MPWLVAPYYMTFLLSASVVSSAAVLCVGPSHLPLVSTSEITSLSSHKETGAICPSQDLYLHHIGKALLIEKVTQSQAPGIRTWASGEA